MQTNKKQTIQRIIQNKYYQNGKYLDLYCERECWSDVLSQRDGSMLKGLNLVSCGITDETLAIFCNLNWPELQNLYLMSNKLSSRGMQLMLSCNLTNLKSLQLSFNLIGNKGVKYLVKMDLPNLEQLRFDCCQIGSEGIKHLLKARWPNLKFLYFGYRQDKNANKLGVSNWELISHHQFQQLKQFYVWQTQPICWISCVLLQNEYLQVYEHGIQISMEEVEESIKRILKDRKFMK